MDTQAKKQALRMLTYGLYVITSGKGAEVSAGTVNWLSQASFIPPLVVAGVKKERELYKTIKSEGVFVVNILGTGQERLAEEFFRPVVVDVEGGLLSGHKTTTKMTGIPIISSALSFLECKVTDCIERGDHSILVGEVIEAGIQSLESPLEMRTTGWFYGG